MKTDSEPCQYALDLQHCFAGKFCWKNDWLVDLKRIPTFSFEACPRVLGAATGIWEGAEHPGPSSSRSTLHSLHSGALLVTETDPIYMLSRYSGRNIILYAPLYQQCAAHLVMYVGQPSSTLEAWETCGWCIQGHEQGCGAADLFWPNRSRSREIATASAPV